MARSQIAIILAGGGVGRRMRNQYKPLLKLHRQEMLYEVLKRFLPWSPVQEVVVVTHQRWREKVDCLLQSEKVKVLLKGRSPVGLVRGKWQREVEESRSRGVQGSGSSDFFWLHSVEGGRERWQSVVRGFRALKTGADWVMIHDVARPFVSMEFLQRLWAARSSRAGVIPALPVSDTLKRVSGRGRVQKTVSRKGLWAVQTPQLFPSLLLERIYQRLERRPSLAEKVTDEAQLFERMGIPVKVVRGAPGNFKITTPDDLALARRIVRR